MVAKASKYDLFLRSVDALLADPALGLVGFVPRPDRPEEFDQQHSFVYHRDQVAFLVKGNAAGGTECAAFKTALYLLEQQPPPRHNTPFWIISDSYDQCVDTCWGEKLYGHGYIPDCEIDWDGVQWLSAKAGQPKRVPLRPWPVERGGDPGKNWVIEFKSYEQGRQKMQARSIGGFWFSEQFPWEVFTEVLRGCREYMFPGGQFCEFTPIDPDLCIALEKMMDTAPSGWAFYRANTRLNTALADGWADQFFATVSDEMLATRSTGALANFQGAIYTTFAPSIHVVDSDEFLAQPGLRHVRGVDWGSSEEHAQTCVWGCRNHEGDWFIYDEFWSNSQDQLTEDHAQELLARSIAWGWPVPPHILTPSPALRHYAQRALARAEELEAPAEPRHDQFFGYTYADPSRPGEMAAFTRHGVATAPASNDVYQGIDYVRSLLKVNPFTGRPRLFIHARCKHLIEEIRKYRWDQKKLAKPQPLKKDDDTVDALRYLLFSESRNPDQPPGSLDTKAHAEGRKYIRLERTARAVTRS